MPRGLIVNRTVCTAVAMTSGAPITDDASSAAASCSRDVSGGCSSGHAQFELVNCVKISASTPSTIWIATTMSGSLSASSVRSRR